MYLVANTIMNVTTQDDQLAVFANAAAHLGPGGHFVIEVIVPQLRRVPPGESACVFTLAPDYVGIETFDDVAGQIAWSHHWIAAGDRLIRHSAPYRYVWPSELDLMAKITGFRLADRWAGWDQRPSPPTAPPRWPSSRNSPEHSVPGLAATSRSAARRAPSGDWDWGCPLRPPSIRTGRISL